jgi:hypothetical protein
MGSGVGEGGAGTSARVVVGLMCRWCPLAALQKPAGLGIRGRSHDVQDDVKLDLVRLAVIRSQ